MMYVLNGQGDIEVTGRTKWSHPYNYDPILQWQSSRSDVSDRDLSCVWTDHLMREDLDRFNDITERHFGNRGHFWEGRPPKGIEAFLRDFLDLPNLELIRVTEHCNQATGYPTWQFHFLPNR